MLLPNLIVKFHKTRLQFLIPGGTLLTLAAIAGLSGRWPGADLGWLLFLGLAYIEPSAKRRRTWALYPAAGLAAMALLRSRRAVAGWSAQ